MARPQGLLYSVGSSLYASLTNRCHTASLITTRGPGFSFGATFPYLPSDYEPSASDVVDAVNGAASSGDFPDWDGRTLVFAGAGEPLLRPDVLSSAVDHLAEGLEVRVVTNGLFPTSLVEQTLRGRVSRASVAVNAHDEATYSRVMAPEGESEKGRWLQCDDGRGPGRLATVHAFVLTCREAGLSVEVTCVERDFIDMAAVQDFAAACGASFRSRSYFA